MYKETLSRMFILNLIKLDYMKILKVNKLNLSMNNSTNAVYGIFLELENYFKVQRNN